MAGDTRGGFRKKRPIYRKTTKNDKHDKMGYISGVHIRERTNGICVNGVLKEYHIAFEIMKTTGPTIGGQLFNNFDKSSLKNDDCNASCFYAQTMRGGIGIRY